jgi:hypothetical protein
VAALAEPEPENAKRSESLEELAASTLRGRVDEYRTLCLAPTRDAIAVLEAASGLAAAA